jgi:hypothetical protein
VENSGIDRIATSRLPVYQPEPTTSAQQPSPGSVAQAEDATAIEQQYADR